MSFMSSVHILSIKVNHLNKQLQSRHSQNQTGIHMYLAIFSVPAFSPQGPPNDFYHYTVVSLSGFIPFTLQQEMLLSVLF